MKREEGSWREIREGEKEGRERGRKGEVMGLGVDPLLIFDNSHTAALSSSFSLYFRFTLIFVTACRVLICMTLHHTLLGIRTGYKPLLRCAKQQSLHGASRL